MMVYDPTFNQFDAPPIIKPNRITGEGRTRSRMSFYKNKAKDLKKKQHRKMAKKSRRLNRRTHV